LTAKRRRYQLDLVLDHRTRANEAHVAAQHVQQLRNLVQAPRAQEAPHARDAVVDHELVELPVLVGLRLAGDEAADEVAVHRAVGVRAHRAELQDGERSHAAAESALTEQHRSGRAQPHREGGHRDERDERAQRQPGHGDVEDAVRQRSGDPRLRLRSRELDHRGDVDAHATSD
jgi:hypothetical protein